MMAKTRWLVLAWAVLMGGCTPSGKKATSAPDPDAFDSSTVDDAHVVGVLELGQGLDCSAGIWCGSNGTFERISITILDDWIGQNTAAHLLVPELATATLTTLFGDSPRVVYAGRVEAPDAPGTYADTCGMPPDESFTYPVDALSIWVIDDDGSRIWELQCVLGVAATLDDTGKDPQGRGLKDALLTRPGCFSTKARARAQAQESAGRVGNRASNVQGENRCLRHDIPDAGSLLP